MESMMTVRQVAELLGVHENWVYDQAASGQLPSYKIGGTRRFDPNEVRGWISDHREPERLGEPRQRTSEKRTAAGGNRRLAQDEGRKSTVAPPARQRVDGSQPRLFD
jgi:excisionase family DNA binding protein